MLHVDVQDRTTALIFCWDERSILLLFGTSPYHPGWGILVLFSTPKSVNKTFFFKHQEEQTPKQLASKTENKVCHCVHSGTVSVTSVSVAHCHCQQSVLSESMVLW